jgi:hypothetical protein
MLTILNPHTSVEFFIGNLAYVKEKIFPIRSAISSMFKDQIDLLGKKDSSHKKI